MASVQARIQNIYPIGTPAPTQCWQRSAEPYCYFVQFYNNETFRECSGVMAAVDHCAKIVSNIFIKLSIFYLCFTFSKPNNKRIKYMDDIYILIFIVNIWNQSGQQEMKVCWYVRFILPLNFFFKKWNLKNWAIRKLYLFLENKLQ